MCNKTENFSEEYTDVDVNQTIGELLQELTKGKQITNNPCITFMGGLPGAGKSSTINNLKNIMVGDVITVDIDAYREFHPKFDEIAKVDRERRERGLDTDYYATQTGNFAWKVKKGLISKLEEKGRSFNLIVDGTARDTKEVIEPAEKAKENGYQAAFVEIVATDKLTAWQGTIDRYDKQVKQEQEEIQAGGQSKTVPRKVGQVYFDSVVKALPVSIDKIHTSKVFKRIRLVNRGVGIYYNSEVTPDINPKETLEKCLEGERVEIIGCLTEK